MGGRAPRELVGLVFKFNFPWDISAETLLWNKNDPANFCQIKKLNKFLKPVFHEIFQPN